jgi:hypothetical protein
MDTKILNKLLYTKLALLFTPCYKRQKYIDKINKYIEECLSEFNEDMVSENMTQINVLPEEDCDELFSKSFDYYDLLKFGKSRLEIDDYNPEDCRTFAQYNNALRLGLMAIDYEESFNMQ